MALSKIIFPSSFSSSSSSSSSSSCRNIEQRILNMEIKANNEELWGVNPAHCHNSLEWEMNPVAAQNNKQNTTQFTLYTEQ